MGTILWQTENYPGIQTRSRGAVALAWETPGSGAILPNITNQWHFPQESSPFHVHRPRSHPPAEAEMHRMDAMGRVAGIATAASFCAWHLISVPDHGIYGHTELDGIQEKLLCLNLTPSRPLGVTSLIRWATSEIGSFLRPGLVMSY